jgi:exosortase
MTQQTITVARSARWQACLAFAGPLLCLLWAYWTTLIELSQRWSYDASYSHGWLVPVFAVVLLWLRRDLLPANLVQPSWVFGGLLLALGVGWRLVGAYFHYVWFDPISLLPCLAGIVLLVGGWPALRWSWPAVLFLGFMIPLPYRYAGMLAEPLQRFATVVSTFLLQALGLPALAEGNVILLSEVEMGIVEACSGLRMLVVFFALSTAFALIVRRPIWEKLLIVASAMPIALAANVLRITATGVLHETVSSELANAVFHDFAGWLMMPIGLGMLGAELKVLQMLLLPPQDGPTLVPVPPVGATPTTAGAPSRARKAWQPSRHSKLNNPTGLA